MQRIFSGLLTISLIILFQDCAKSIFYTDNGSPAAHVGTTPTASGNNQPEGGSTTPNKGPDLGNLDGPVTVPPVTPPQPGADGGGVDDPKCHDFEHVSLPLKIIVAVDNTGSNGYNKDGRQVPPGGRGEPGDGSDINQVFRQSQVSSFLDSVQDLQNLSYNFMFFQDLRTVHWREDSNSPPVKSLINYDNDNQKPAFGNVDQMRAALASFQTETADGYSMYDFVLDLINKGIQYDIAHETVQQNYAVVILSDGVATNRYGTPNTPDEDALIYQQVQDIVSLSPGHVTVSTIFYNTQADASGPEIDNAPPRLQKIALVGHGQFANSRVQGSKLKLSNVITIPSAVCKAK